MVRSIELTQGREALVDDEDYDQVSQFKWYAGKIRNTYYAMRTVDHATQYMHTLITGYVKTDHKNGNGLDNRKENLRETTDVQNQHNSQRSRSNTSGYKGVSWEGRRNRWLVLIRADGKQRFIGRYPDVIEAAHAYDNVARHYFGEFARVNFPEEASEEMT